MLTSSNVLNQLTVPAYDAGVSCPCRQRRPGADGPAPRGSSCAASPRCASSAGTADSSLLLPGCPRAELPLPAGVLGSAAALRASSTSDAREGWAARGWGAQAWADTAGRSAQWPGTQLHGAVGALTVQQTRTLGGTAGSLTFPWGRPLGHGWEMEQPAILQSNCRSGGWAAAVSRRREQAGVFQAGNRTCPLKRSFACRRCTASARLELQRLPGSATAPSESSTGACRSQASSGATHSGDHLVLCIPGSAAGGVSKLHPAAPACCRAPAGPLPPSRLPLPAPGPADAAALRGADALEAPPPGPPC